MTQTELRERCPITLRLHETIEQMRTRGIDGEPLILTRNELPQFLKELPLFKSKDFESVNRAVLLGKGLMTFGGYPVKIL